MSRWTRVIQAAAAAAAVVGGYIASRAWRPRPDPGPPLSKAERKAARKLAVARATARRG